MGITDIILLACYIPGIIRGILKGFVEQAVAFFSILLGVWLACRFSARASAWLSTYIPWKPELLRAATFVIIVILTILVFFLIGRLLTKVIKISTLGWLNRLLGILLGIVVTTLILGVVVVVGGAWLLAPGTPIETKATVADGDFKFADTVLYVTYFVVCVAILSLIWSAARKAIKK